MFAEKFIKCFTIRVSNEEDDAKDDPFEGIRCNCKASHCNKREKREVLTKNYSIYIVNAKNKVTEGVL